jgi:type I restriction modification DNA specificity protein
LLELRKVATIVSGVPIRETGHGPARFMRLSDISDILASRKPTFAAGEAPVVERALIIEEGDLVVAARGESTDVLLASDVIIGSYVSLDLYLVRPNPAHINPLYLHAFLTLPATQSLFALKKQGSSLARLPKEELERIAVPLPPLQMQRQIAGLAGCIEDEHRLLNRLTDLKSIFGREVLARAIARAGDSTRSDQ